MGTFASRLVLLWAIALLAACDEAPSDTDAGPGRDAGLGRDGGEVDAGEVDAGNLDSGAPLDAGPRDDTGVPEDAGPGSFDAGSGDAGAMTVACDAPIPPLGVEPITATRFSSPLYVAQPPGSTDLYVVQRDGRIRIVRDGTVLATNFLDLSGRLSGTPTGDAEWGLLGLAFHPDYASNGRFFVAYTPSGGDNIVAEGRRSAGNPDVAEPTVTPIVSVPDFASNHNGGMLAFGPDGMLYVGTGDGGGRGDPRRTAQDLSSALGKILRLDVSTPGMARAPADNPFAGMAGADARIWAYGLRNPWRFSFDRETGDLWIGDVGQDRVEEIDFDARSSGGGDNYGWSAFEGTRGFVGGDMLRGPSPHHPPIVEYTHADGQSVVGGYVYRGSAIPGLRGAYLFGDSYEGWVRAMRACDGRVTRLPEDVPGLETGPSGRAGLVSFGEDNAGELYLVYLTGQVMRIVAR
jgi:glucose/arabinose dehydrogenase